MSDSSTPTFSNLEILDDVTEMLIGYRGFTKRRKRIG